MSRSQERIRNIIASMRVFADEAYGDAKGDRQWALDYVARNVDAFADRIEKAVGPSTDAAMSASRIDPPVPSPGGVAKLRNLIVKYRRLAPTYGVQEWDDLLGDLAGLLADQIEAAAVVPSPSAPELVEITRTVNKLIDGYDAQFWHDSYVMVRDAVIENLEVHDDDVAEEAIIVEAIEQAGKIIKAAVSSSSVADPWQPIETVPDDVLRILTVEGGSNAIIAIRGTNGMKQSGWFLETTPRWQIHPKVWLPLPSASSASAEADQDPR